MAVSAPGFIRIVLLVISLLPVPGAGVDVEAGLALAESGREIYSLRFEAAFGRLDHALQGQVKIEIGKTQTRFKFIFSETDEKVLNFDEHSGVWMDISDYVGPGVLAEIGAAARAEGVMVPASMGAGVMTTIPVSLAGFRGFAHFFTDEDQGALPENIWLRSASGPESYRAVFEQSEQLDETQLRRILSGAALEPEPPDQAPSDEYCREVATSFKAYAREHQAEMMGLVMSFEEENAPLTDDQERDADIKLFENLLRVAELDPACAGFIVDDNNRPQQAGEKETE